MQKFLKVFERQQVSLSRSYAYTMQRSRVTYFIHVRVASDVF